MLILKMRLSIRRDVIDDIAHFWTKNWLLRDFFVYIFGRMEHMVLIAVNVVIVAMQMGAILSPVTAAVLLAGQVKLGINCVKLGICLFVCLFVFC